jgi:hypothetical protein
MKTTTDVHPTTHPGFGVALGVIPFERSYIVVPGRLLAGLYPASDQEVETTEKLQRLLAVGVNHIVNLTEPHEANYQGVRLVNYEPELTDLAAEGGQDIVCRRFPVRDLDVPSVTTMKAILDDIDGAAARGCRCFLHCWGGRGRTGTVVGCYLARHGLAVGNEALAMVRYLRRTDAKSHTESPETDVQKEFVRRWSVGQ